MFVGLYIALAVFKICGWSFPYLFWGAINVPSQPGTVEKMIELSGAGPGKKAVDLGCGEGRLVIALAKAGAEAHGFEINPFLVRRAKEKIKQEGLDDKAFVYLKNLWKQDLSDFDVVTIYAMKHMMNPLGKKLQKELKSGAKVVSNHFQFKNWKPAQKKDDIYLYIKE